MEELLKIEISVFVFKSRHIHIKPSGTVMLFPLKVYHIQKLIRTKKEKIICDYFHTNRYNKTNSMIIYLAEAEYEYDRE